MTDEEVWTWMMRNSMISHYYDGYRKRYAHLFRPMSEQTRRAIGMAPDFTVKDSGQRRQFSTGMQRDTTEDKIRYDLVFDGPMFERLAVHLTKGAGKYDARNWMKAATHEELERFRESAVRHFIQWLRGDMDEDHAAAVMFNVNGFEYTKQRVDAR